MEMIMFILLGVSCLIFILSFFQKDPYKELKEEIDQFTIQQVQDLYQIKKKLKVLEEELLLNEVDLPRTVVANSDQKKEIHDIIKNQVIALSQQGKPLDQIAVQSSLSLENVYSILKEAKERGITHE